MTTPPPLHVEVVLPPAPYALATSGFLATLAAVEAEIASIRVTDTQSAQAAANIQARLTTAGTALEKQRQSLKQPFIAAGRAIDDAARAPADRIESAKSAVKAKLAAYDAEQRRIAAEAEAKRQAELRALREQQEREAAQAREAARKAAEESERLAKASEVPVMEVEDDEPPAPTATEQKIAALAAAPAVVAPRPVGVTFKTTLTATVIDINKLPDIFVEKTPKLRAIQSTFCVQWKEGMPLPECEGVRFEVKREPVSTGRGSFG